LVLIKVNRLRVHAQRRRLRRVPIRFIFEPVNGFHFCNRYFILK